MLSAHTGIEEPAFAKRSLSKIVADGLYGFSPIGDAWAIIYPLRPLLSTACLWTSDCPLLSSISFPKEIDAEGPEGRERRSGLYADRADERRKCSRVQALFASEPKGRRIVMDLKDQPWWIERLSSSSGLAKRTASRPQIARHTFAGGSPESGIDYHHSGSCMLSFDGRKRNSDFVMFSRTRSCRVQGFLGIRFES
jgi:hypothetical protein